MRIYERSLRSAGYGTCACSAVRNGRYYGRNLDYYVNECADLVITMKASKDRFASIGTSADFPPVTKKAIDEGTLSEMNYAAAAYYMNDATCLTTPSPLTMPSDFSEA